MSHSNTLHTNSSSGHSSATYHSHGALYLKVFLALLVLTIITVGASRIDFGTWNIVVAMGIASIKAALVAIIFMHLSHEDKATWIYAIFPLVLMAILIGLLFLDNPFRVNPDGSWEYPLPAGNAAVEHAASGHAAKAH